MALFVVRGVNLCSISKLNPALAINLSQVAGITSAGGKPRPRQYRPFDYRRKKFKFIDQPFDRTLRRLDENSKVIIIDGPMASGKTEFAKRLAQQLDFKFVPQPDTKPLYKCGVDGLTFQDLDDLLPEQHRIYDLDSFYKDPKAKVAEGGGRAGWLQVEHFTARLFAYNDALLHLLSTGQGVVCVRSPWSDRVFARALFDNGYMSRAGFKYYKEDILAQHLCDYPRPHLTIYLDANVEQTKENIKRRNNPTEVNSKILDDGFLQSIENEYKDVVLPGLERHSELLVYPSIPNITDHEVELMVEDIEALGDIKHSGFADDHHLEDWENLRDEELAHKRREYQDLNLAVLVMCHKRPWGAPEMCQTDDWILARKMIYDRVPGYQYETGYDPTINPWWKTLLGQRAFKTNEDRRYFWIPA